MNEEQFHDVMFYLSLFLFAALFVIYGIILFSLNLGVFS